MSICAQMNESCRKVYSHSECVISHIYTWEYLQRVHNAASALGKVLPCMCDTTHSYDVTRGFPQNLFKIFLSLKYRCLQFTFLKWKELCSRVLSSIVTRCHWEMEYTGMERVIRISIIFSVENWIWVGRILPMKSMLWPTRTDTLPSLRLVAIW